MPSENGALMTALEWVVDIDPAAIIGSVQAERKNNPNMSNAKLVKRTFSRARWKATAAGVVTGLPSNPWVAAPAAVTDVAITLKTEVSAVARTAVIYNEHFFEDEDAKWELLVPIFGMNATSQLFREIGVRGGMGVTRAAIKKYLSKETLKVFKRVMLKYFGLKVTQRTVITHTLPIIGGFIGGTWNYFEVGAVKKRSVKFFEDN